MGLHFKSSFRFSILQKAKKGGARCVTLEK